MGLKWKFDSKGNRFLRILAGSFGSYKMHDPQPQPDSSKAKRRIAPILVFCVVVVGLIVLYSAMTGPPH